MSLGWGHAFVAAAIALNATGHVLVKRASDGSESSRSLYLRPRLAIGYLCLAGMTVCTQLALTRITLRELSAWITLYYPATLALGAWWLGESLGRREVGGLALIVGGLVLFALA